MPESFENSGKEMGMGIIRISISASSTLARELRNVLIALQYSLRDNGEKHYEEWLKSMEGHRFNDESSFINVTYGKKQSDVEKTCVSREDRAILERCSHKLGIDYFLARRPTNLEELVQKFVNGEKLSEYDLKTVQAFTLRDKEGNMQMDPENPKMPLLAEGEYIFCFATKDLPKWEVVCSQLENRQKTLRERIQDSKLLSHIMNKTQDKEVEKTVKGGPEK